MTEVPLLLPSPNWFSGNATSVSVDGKHFAFAANNTIVVLDLGTYQLKSLLHGHSRKVSGLCFCGDGQLCSIGQDGTIRAWNVQRMHNAKTLYKQPANLTVLDAFSNDDALDAVVIGDGRGALMVWRLCASEIVISCLRTCPRSFLLRGKLYELLGTIFMKYCRECSNKALLDGI